MTQGGHLAPLPTPTFGPALFRVSTDFLEVSIAHAAKWSAFFHFLRNFGIAPSPPLVDAIDDARSERQYEQDVDDEPEITADVHDLCRTLRCVSSSQFLKRRSGSGSSGIRFEGLNR